MYSFEFVGVLFRWHGPAAWHFVEVPAEHAPTTTEAWGRKSVEATIDGRDWKTSVWREKSGRTVLPVPKKIRGEKRDGDQVSVRIVYPNL